MTDRPIAVDPIEPPEYTAEQVEAAKRGLDVAEQDASYNGHLIAVSRGYIRTILSALSAAESLLAAGEIERGQMQLVIDQQDRDYKRVMARAESAEADSKRLDWMLKYGARHTDNGTSTDRDGYWYTIQWDFGGWAEGLSLRDAIDAGMAATAAMTKERE